MPEHVHEWQLITDWWRKSNWFRCRHCGAEIGIDKAEARLNEYETLKAATERLSADKARDLLNISWKWRHSLKSYANILEGKGVD